MKRMHFANIKSNTVILGLGFGMALTAFEAWRYPVIWAGANVGLSSGNYACMVLGLMAFLYAMQQRLRPVRGTVIVGTACLFTLSLFCYGSLDAEDGSAVLRMLASLHMGLGIMFFTLWIQELLTIRSEAAISAFIIGLLLAFGAQSIVVLLNAAMANGVCATFPLTSALLFLLYRANTSGVWGATIDSNNEAITPSAPRPLATLAFTAAFALVCGMLFNLLNKAWQMNISGVADISDTNVQLFSAAGSLIAAVLLIVSPQRTRVPLVELFIVIFALMALLASNMGAGVFPLYLVPLNAAQKLIYALFFLLAFERQGTPRGMAVFCILFCLYRIGLMLLSPTLQLLGLYPFGLAPEGARYVVIVVGSAVLLTYALASLLHLAKAANNQPQPDSGETGVGSLDASPSEHQLNAEAIERYKAVAFKYYCSEKYRLTSREAEIALLLEKGGNMRSIAEALVISQGTAKAHIRNIYTKLGVHSKEEATQELAHTREEFFEG